MPIGFLTVAERERLDRSPAQVVPGDLETYFTLSRADRRQVSRGEKRGQEPILAFAPRLVSLISRDGHSAPPKAALSWSPVESLVSDMSARLDGPGQRAAEGH